MPFQKGNPGRPKGSKNKASLPWKEFVTQLVLDPAVQGKLKEMALERPDLVFKAAEFAYGKPHQSVDLSMSDRKMVNWPARVATDEDFGKGSEE